MKLIRAFLLSAAFQFAVCLVAIALLSSSANASTVIYSDLGGGYQNAGYVLWSPGTGPDPQWAEFWTEAKFVALATGPVSQIDIALEASSITYNVSLYSDDNGEAWQGLCYGLVVAPQSGGIHTVTPNGCPVLQAGTAYWIEVTDVSNGGPGQWDYNNQNTQGYVQSPNRAYGYPDGEWTVLPAFDILTSAAATPEPSSLLLLLCGSVTLLTLRRR